MKESTPKSKSQPKLGAKTKAKEKGSKLKSISKNRKSDSPAKLSRKKEKFSKKGINRKSDENQSPEDYENEYEQNDTQGQELNSFGFIDKRKLLQMNTEKQVKVIKDLFDKITVSPEQNFKQVETLFILTKTSNLKVVSVALRTLAQVFISVAPLDYIDVRRLDNRTEHKITKEEFSVIRFEKMLVEQYDRFIGILKELRSKLKKENFGTDIELFTEFKKCILQCALTCFDTLWNFNFSRELCDLLMNFIKFKECRESFRRLLADKNAATANIKAKIINCISQLVKKKEDSELPDDLIQLINSTHIDSNYLEKDREAVEFKKKKIKKRMYKQEAYDKKMEKEKAKENPDKLQEKRKKKQEKMKLKMKIKEEINREFAEGDATVSKKELTQNNSKILQELFYIYFKVLVERIDSKFLRDVLDGVLSFAHLINIDLISSMISHLDTASKIFREIWRKSKSNGHMETRIMIVFTMESILNGPLSVYNMDDHSATSNLFKIFKDINHSSQTPVSKQTFRLMGICLEEAFIKKRQLSIEIVGSFAREISVFLVRKEVPKLYLLEFLRMLGSKYHKVSRMFEEDNEGYGIHAYNPICEDPQSTNAINTQILSNLKAMKPYDKAYKQYRDDVQQYLTNLFKQNFHKVEGTESLEKILLNDIVVGFE